MHFFTIVLNGEPFIRYHLDVFRQLSFRWHWHVIEGVASLVHDTAWSVAAGGRIDPDLHDEGRSNDGTTAYLDEIAGSELDRISIYRAPPGRFWDGKREMVSAPLSRIHEESLLWQIDSDELWTAQQITRVRDLFIEQPERTSAYYWCDYFVGPEAVVTTRYNYAQDPGVEWLRTWRYRPGDRWDAHEPPTLARSRWRRSIDVGKFAPFLHDETERVGAVFQHFAYATEEQVRFKESYYGYGNARDGWLRLQGALSGGGPVRLGDYLPWVKDDTLADIVARSRVAPIARDEHDRGWVFDDNPSRATAEEDVNRGGVIVIDGVFFQDFATTGIARVWRSYLREWLKSGFAERIVFLDRGGAGPRFPGLRTRSVPLWCADAPAEDSLMLQRICDEEGAALFISTYYTAPIFTPSLLLVYDMIPERLGLDMPHPIWEEKRLAIEHASAYICISDNTLRDLLELKPGTASKRAHAVPLGVEGVFRPAQPQEVGAFRRAHRLDRPYYLVVGDRRGVDGYKNVQLVFRAFGEWREAAEYEIVCIGGHAEIEPDLARLAPKIHVRRLALDDEELRLAYAGAQALVYPSLYEGFGLPVVEAMACGCPVITTPVASLPEVGGEAVVYVDPDDPAGLARALDVVREPKQRAAMIAAGTDRAAMFNWRDAAATCASLISMAAAADAEADRKSRSAVWMARRQAQASIQRTLGVERIVSRRTATGRNRTAAASRRLETMALRYLPPWAVRRLRALKSAVSQRRRNRRLWSGRRR